MLKKSFKSYIDAYSKLPIVIHPLFVLFGLYCIIVGLWQVFLCYTLSAVFHEVGHFIVAKRCGYKMIQLRLMPYGAELSGELDEFIYNDEIKIALAGPVTSFIIAIITIAMWWIAPNCYGYTYDFCISNIVCAIFNFLPIYPLDGGRVVVAMLSRKIRRIDAVRYAKIATRVFSLMLFGLFILSFLYTYNISFGIVSIMLFVSASSSSMQCNYLRLNVRIGLNKNLSKGLEVVELVVNKKTKIYKIYSKLRSQKFYRFIVVDDKMQTERIVDELIFNNITAEDFKKSFEEILLLKYNKKINVNR